MGDHRTHEEILADSTVEAAWAQVEAINRLTKLVGTYLEAALGLAAMSLRRALEDEDPRALAKEVLLGVDKARAALQAFEEEDRE